MSTELDIPALKRQLKVHEGYRTKVYKDTAGHPTIGVGFNLDRADARTLLTRVGASFDDIRNGVASLDDDQIDYLLDKTMLEAIVHAKLAFSDGVFDRLDSIRKAVVVDMVFNMGASTFSHFKGTISAITEGDYALAASRMEHSLWYKQVGNRGRILCKMMKTGEAVYD